MLWHLNTIQRYLNLHKWFTFIWKQMHFMVWNICMVSGVYVAAYRSPSPLWCFFSFFFFFFFYYYFFFYSFGENGIRTAMTNLISSHFQNQSHTYINQTCKGFPVHEHAFTPLSVTVHDLEVMGLKPGQVEFRMCSPSQLDFEKHVAKWMRCLI